MKIGIACPYSWDVPGGVQFHIRDLAEELIGRGHSVSVIAPAGEGTDLPDFVVPTGAAIPIPYNGSVARLAFGPRMNWHVRKWLAHGEFDVLHVHEPFVPSLAMLALMNAECPVVATFHTAMDRSKALSTASPLLVPVLEKTRARIAVSEEARRTAVEHLGGDAYVIPNGVSVKNFLVSDKDERFTGTPDSPTIGFLGRIDEPRKGLPILAEAVAPILAAYPKARFFVAGRGDNSRALDILGENASAVSFLGSVSEEDKAAMLSSVDVYVAPQTGGESFGIVLIEAMSAGSFVVSSDIPAFQAVLEHGAYGDHFRSEDPQDLARVIVSALDDPDRRAAVVREAGKAAWRYDWSTVASQILSVYSIAVKTAGYRIEGWGR
ncbi:glycosyltransferase family 4 protein [Flaviflexus equikiangi]|uniref:glycosyltransferase family 4 protein n=1 Tax=Flaviflexus equikiangi TaxID=2758573 RepID=UPI0015F776CE|nr:glycosyltransferase family 4 protein [Flaviflexus equikiangi]